MYTTPKSYLELLKLFISLLEKKHVEADAAILRLEGGVLKLAESAEAVANLEDNLKVKKLKVESCLGQSTRTTCFEVYRRMERWHCRGQLYIASEIADAPPPKLILPIVKRKVFLFVRRPTGFNLDGIASHGTTIFAVSELLRATPSIIVLLHRLCWLQQRKSAPNLTRWLIR